MRNLERDIFLTNLIMPKLKKPWELTLLFSFGGQKHHYVTEAEALTAKDKHISIHPNFGVIGPTYKNPKPIDFNTSHGFFMLWASMKDRNPCIDDNLRIHYSLIDPCIFADYIYKYYLPVE